MILCFKFFLCSLLGFCSILLVCMWVDHFMCVVLFSICFVSFLLILWYYKFIILLYWSCAMRHAICSCNTFNWDAAVFFISAFNSVTPFGSFNDTYWPSPTLISTFAVAVAADNKDDGSLSSLFKLPRRFLATVAIIVPGSFAARGDPFWELWLYNCIDAMW